MPTRFDYHWISIGYPKCSLSNATSMVFSYIHMWIPHDLPPDPHCRTHCTLVHVHCDAQWISHWVAIGCPWDSHGIPIALPLVSQFGLPTVPRCISVIYPLDVHWIPCGFPLIHIGFPLAHHLEPTGSPFDLRWISI